MLAFCVVLLAWLVAATVAADVDINNDLIFREVSRGIDLTTNLARHKVSITVNNGGAKEVSRSSRVPPAARRLPSPAATHTSAGRFRFVVGVRLCTCT